MRYPPRQGYRAFLSMPAKLKKKVCHVSLLIYFKAAAETTGEGIWVVGKINIFEIFENDLNPKMEETAHIST